MAKHILDTFSKNLFKTSNSSTSSSNNNNNPSNNNAIPRNSNKTSSKTKLICNGNARIEMTYGNPNEEDSSAAACASEDENDSFCSAATEQGQDDDDANNKKSKHEHHEPFDRKSEVLLGLMSFENRKNGKGSQSSRNSRFRHESTDTEGDGSSSSSSSSMERIDPPDGGWGWVVVFSAFLINLVSDGVTFSFGIFYVEFYKYFLKDFQSKSPTAWIGSLLASMPLLSGPIASLLTDRFGCRNVTIAGSFFAGLGFVLASFADNLFVVYLTFGVLTGFGLSLCYVAAVVIVAYYFERRRSLATGLSVCGGGIGTFLFAPFTQYLMDSYGNWWEPTRVLSGAFFSLSICGLLMKDLEWTKKRNKSLVPCTDIESDEVSGGMKSERLFSSAVCIPTFVQEESKEALNSNNSINDSKQKLSESDNAAQTQTINHIENNISLTTNTNKRNSLTFSPETFSRDENLIFTLKNPGKNKPNNSSNSKANKSDSFRSNKSNTTRGGTPGISASNGSGLHRHSLTYRGAVVNLKRYRLRPASSCPDIISVATEEKTSYEWKTLVARTCKYIKGLYEWQNLTKTKFLFFLISNFLLYMWYDCPYVYLKDAADQNSYPEYSSSKLISIVGIFNMLGNIFLGYIGDKKWTDAIMVYGVCMIVCGTTIACLPLFMTWNYVVLAMGCAVFGLTIAANYSLTSVILVRVVSLDGFSNAYGLLLLVQGIGNLIGPPLAGVIIDLSGAILWAFVAAGSGIALSSIFILAPRLLSIGEPENVEVDDNDHMENGPEVEQA